MIFICLPHLFFLFVCFFFFFSPTSFSDIYKKEKCESKQFFSYIRVLYIKMNKGAVSVIFSDNCSIEEKNKTLNFFKMLDYTNIEQNQEIKGRGFRILEFNSLLKNEAIKQTRTVATQTKTFERPGSPSMFASFKSKEKLYEGLNG